MSYAHEASTVMISAEASLRSLLEKALTDRSYGEVAHIAALADAVQDLSQRANGTVDVRHVAPHQRALAGSPPIDRRGHQYPKRLAPARKRYPRFERDGDKLVKIGWSKKSRAEYEHRAPLAVAHQLISAIRMSVEDGEQFTAAEIMPLATSDGSRTIPDYQAYLMLKWLHSQGIVSKYGRERYAIQPGKMGDGALDRLWSELGAHADATGRNGGRR